MTAVAVLHTKLADVKRRSRLALHAYSHTSARAPALPSFRPGYVMYGDFMCSNCITQKALFQDAFGLLNYVECNEKAPAGAQVRSFHPSLPLPFPQNTGCRRCCGVGVWVGFWV